MRYSHRYHQSLHSVKRSRHRRLTSLVYLGLAIVVMLGVFGTRLDARLFLGGFASSLGRVIAAYILSLVLAIILGLSSVSSPIVEAILVPVLDLAQSFPTFAILPILVFYFGSSSISVVLILTIAMLWPIVFSVIGGVKDERVDQAEAAKLFGARGWRHFVYYRWPMLRPHVMTGSIVSWGQAWDTIVGAEIIAGVAGAGHYLGTLGTAGNTKLLMLGILVYLLFIFSINQLIWLPLLHTYTKYQAE
jgi:ABC-type nitrate/sulfonate/bicarbonate transport system permease component